MESIKPLIEALISLLTLVVLALTPVLIKWAINAFEARTKVQVDAADERKVVETVEKAIHFADEKARAAVGADASAPGQKKMAAAVEFIKTEAERLGLDNVVEAGSEHIAQMVEARLNQKRMDPNDKLDVVPGTAAAPAGSPAGATAVIVPLPLTADPAGGQAEATVGVGA